MTDWQNLNTSASDFPLGLKIAATLSPAHWEAGQCIFKNLLKSQEFDNRLIDAWMKTQSAFVWPNGLVELTTESTIDLHFSLVIHPWHAELKNTFRLAYCWQNFGIFWVFGEQGA